jgi:probable HAF family extracellular repeat protein
MNRKRIRTFVGIACLLAAASFPLSAQEYRIVELGTLGGPGSIAVAISENGIISGWAMLPSGEWHAVIWDRSGIVDLGTPPGAIESRANAANEFGQVAANAEVGPQSQGYLVENGIWTPIGNLPGTSESRANDIDSGGRIVGSSYTPDGVSRAIIWDAGVLTDLGTLFSTASAVAINEAGQVVGVADIGLPAGGQEFRGFLWENGQMTALDPQFGCRHQRGGADSWQVDKRRIAAILLELARRGFVGERYGHRPGFGTRLWLELCQRHQQPWTSGRNRGG